MARVDGSTVWARARRAIDAVYKLIQQSAPAAKGAAPAGRMSWLAASPERARIKWLFNRRQTVVLTIAALALFAVILVMVFPVLPTLGPAGLIYLFHDEIVLPWQGRIFQRYAPVPQITVIILILLAIVFVFAKSAGGLVYERWLRLWLRAPGLRTVSARWLSLRPTDAHLWSALEAEYRRSVDNWLADRSGDASATTRELGRFLLRLPWNETDQAHDVALAGLAARHIIVSTLLDPAKTVETGPALKRAKGPVCRSLQASLQDDKDAAEPLDTAWDLAGRRHPPHRDTARDAVVWCAWAVSLRRGDAAIARRFQSRLAEIVFKRDLDPAKAKDDNLLFDPGLWSLGPIGDARSAQPGAAMSSDAVGDLLAKLQQGDRRSS